MTAHLLTAYYWMSTIVSAAGAVLLLAAAHKAALPLRPWFAAAVPAAVGYFAVNLARLMVENDARLTDVARGLTLYGLIVLYNAMPYAAIRHASHVNPPVLLDNFVNEVARQLNEDNDR